MVKKLNKTTLKIVYTSLLSLLCLATNTARAQEYDPFDVQVINNLIANGSLAATPDVPETWEFATWNDESPKKIKNLLFVWLSGDVSLAGLTSLETFHMFMSPMKNSNSEELPNLRFPIIINKLDFSNCTSLQIVGGLGYWGVTEIDLTKCKQLKRLDFSECRLTELDLTDCTQLEELWCNYNYLTELDVTNCTQIKRLWCGSNKITELDVTNCTQLERLSCGLNNLTELDVTNCTQLERLYCDTNKLTELDLTGLNKLVIFDGDRQKVSLSLIKNDNDEYTNSIILNNPTFGNSAISYFDGILKSSDNTVANTAFTVQTIGQNYQLSGTLNFEYSDVRINDLKLQDVLIYPNPTKGEFSVSNKACSIVYIEISDIAGRIVHREPSTVNPETVEVDISHLPAGIYFIKIDTKQGKITNKIVKQ